MDIYGAYWCIYSGEAPPCPDAVRTVSVVVVVVVVEVVVLVVVVVVTSASSSHFYWLFDRDSHNGR